MDDLIAALIILRRYGNPHYPTNCEHDTLWADIDPNAVAPEDIQRLDSLGFFPDSNRDGFLSYRFGSC